MLGQKEGKLEYLGGKALNPYDYLTGISNSYPLSIGISGSYSSSYWISTKLQILMCVVRERKDRAV